MEQLRTSIRGNVRLDDKLVIMKNTAPVCGAVFDMDGVLLDTEKLYVRFWKQAAADFGYDMTNEIVFGIRSLARKYSVPRLRSVFGEDFPFEKIHARRVELMDEYIRKNGFETKKGLHELLDCLDSVGCKKAVATATRRERALRYLDSVGILHRFDAIICGDMVTNGKPDPEIYLTAAGELDLPAEQCAAFEDSPNGILSAYRAGCRTIMIPDLTQPDEQVMPLLTAVYDDLAQAAAFFERRNVV